MTKAIKNTLTNDADFTKLAASIHRRTDTVQNDIHRYLVAVAVQWNSTGDSRPVPARVNSLIDGMPKGIRCNAIREWVERMLGLTYALEGDNANSFVVGTAKGKDLDIDKLTQKRWFEMKPETPYKPLDLAADLQKLLKAANKRADTATDADNIPLELLSALNTLAAAMPTAYQH